MKNIKKNAVITWGSNITRSQSLAAKLGYFDYHLKPVFKKQYLKIFNYIFSSVKMFFFLLVNRPKTIVIVLPPIFLIYIAFIYKWVTFSKVNIICDLHNGVIRGEWANWPLVKYLFNKSDYVISHNNVVKKSIDKHFEISSTVLSDPLSVYDITPENHSSFLKSNKINVLVPVSYADDEPIVEIINAAQKLNSDFNFILTGNFKKKFTESEAEELPITFTGFIAESEYVDILLGCDVLLCLTLNDDIQMCALIEAISAEKPFVCSNNSVNNTMFSDFYFCTTENSADGIVSAFESFRSHPINVNFSDAKNTYNKNWTELADEIFK